MSENHESPVSWPLARLDIFYSFDREGEAVDGPCSNCREFKKTVGFKVHYTCKTHHIKKYFVLRLCRNCISDMEESPGQAAAYMEICPACAREIIAACPSTNVPDSLPEDIC